MLLVLLLGFVVFFVVNRRLRLEIWASTWMKLKGTSGVEVSHSHNQAPGYVKE